MRPRLLHLGYTIEKTYQIDRNKASMRPRLLHLGYCIRCEIIFAWFGCFNEAEAFTPRIPSALIRLALRDLRASMRPRLLHLGYLSGSAWSYSASQRFNEAEAFTPRILAFLCSPLCARKCFNEAEAFTPRIHFIGGTATSPLVRLQ